MKRFLLCALLGLAVTAKAAPMIGGPTIGPGVGGSGSIIYDETFTNIVQSLAGGGIVSNYIDATDIILIDTWYTNTTTYWVQPLASIEMQNASSTIVEMQVRTNLANTDAQYMRRIATGDSDSTLSATLHTTFLAPPGAAWRWAVTQGSAAIDNTAPQGTELVYWGSGGSGGTGTLADGSVTTNKIDTTFYEWVDSQAGIASLDATNFPISDEYLLSRMPGPIRSYRTWTDFTTIEDTTNRLSEQYIIDQCFWYKTNGMKAAGWEWIIIEEGWQGPLNPDGTFTVSSLFPSGMASIAHIIKTNGFKPAIYTSTHPTVSTTCLGYPGTVYTNVQKHVQQFVDWGYEGIFVDACSGWVTGTAAARKQELLDRVRIWNNAIQKTGKNPWLLITPPQDGLLTDEGTQTSIQATLEMNVWHWGHLPDVWDFLPSVSVSVVADYYRTNLPKFTATMIPGRYYYGQVISYSALGPQRRASIAVQSVTDSFFSATSTQNRTGYPIDPVTYNPTTWYQGHLQYLTNREVAAVHLNRSGAGRLVFTNATFDVWRKTLGGGTNAFAVINKSGSPANISMSTDWIPNYNNEALTWRDAFHLTNFTSDVVGAATITIAASDAALITTFPSTSAAVWQPYTFREATLAGTGASINTASAFGPSPFFNIDGVAQTAGNATFYFYFAAPTWATRATMAIKMYSAGGAVAWTNAPGYEYYNDTTRVSRSVANDANLVYSDVLTTSGQAKWFTNVWTMVATNAPKTISLNVNAGTNSSARYIIGPAYIKFE